MSTPSGNGKKGSRERELVRRALSGSATEQTRREVSERVSQPVKRAVDKAIRENRDAIRELAKH